MFTIQNNTGQSSASINNSLKFHKQLYICSDNYGNGEDFGDRGDKGERNERGRGRGRGGRGGGRGGGRSGDGEGEHEPEFGEDGEPKKPPVTYVPPEPTNDESEIFSSTITSGINFNKFDHIAVKVSIVTVLLPKRSMAK